MMLFSKQARTIFPTAPSTSQRPDQADLHSLATKTTSCFVIMASTFSARALASRPELTTSVESIPTGAHRRVLPAEPRRAYPGDSENFFSMMKLPQPRNPGKVVGIGLLPPRHLPEPLTWCLLRTVLLLEVCFIPRLATRWKRGAPMSRPRHLLRAESTFRLRSTYRAAIAVVKRCRREAY